MQTATPFYDEVIRLAAAYNTEYDRVGRDGLNEAETRIRFLDNLLRALGWDVGNSESRRVLVEPKHRDAFPDYEILQRNGDTAFLVEAKRASDPKNDSFTFHRDEIFQAKQYAYMKGVPFVILSNFALTMVFAVTRPPELLSPLDQSVPELRLTPKSTAKQWERFAHFFSTSGVDDGTIQELLSITPARQREPVTVALLKRLLLWRKNLGTAYLTLNQQSTDEQIDGAATSLIDKILFTRILIDKKLETEDFFPKIAASDSVYKDLASQFKRLDNDYNGAIFAHHEGDDLRHPDTVIASVLKQISARSFVFNLANIPIEILGDIYETFIGVRLIRKSRTAMVFELNENIKKEHGIYFTPKKYVDMMVDRVLRNRLDGTKYTDILKIKVIDPACGSGTFLIAAYHALLEAALQYWKFQPHGPKRNKAIQTYNDREVLTIRIKREILQSCIFGVDLDKNALDIAALSLYLILLDEDSRSGVLIAGTALPPLNGNLVCGNSLVDDAAVTDHALQWQRAFPEIFENGGFDVVVANPPYVFGEQLPEAEKSFLKSRYIGLGDQMDLYAAFLELTATRLCKPGGAYAYIIPDAILAREQRADLRNALLENAPPRIIAHVGTVFTKLKVESVEEAQLTHNNTGVSAAILIGSRQRRLESIEVVEASEDGLWTSVNSVPVSQITKDRWTRFLIYVLPEEWPIFDLLRKAPTLENLLRVDAEAKGISRGEELGKNKLFASPSRDAKIPVIAGDAVSPYHLDKSRYYVKEIRKQKSCYSAPKILVRKTDDRLFACAEDEGAATLQSVYNLQVNPKQFHSALAVLNSRFSQWFFKRTVTQYKKLMPQITQGELLSLPFPASPRDYEPLVRKISTYAIDKASGLNGPVTRRFTTAYDAIEDAVITDLGIQDHRNRFE